MKRTRPRHATVGPVSPLAFRAGALLVGLLLLAGPWLVTAHRGEAQTPVKIRVEVTDNGFNNTPGDYTIEVEQGRLVELTFVWAHQAYPREEHIMVLEGYKLESDKIDGGHRETTLRFIADKAGTFGFQCDIECDLHDFLQRGHLKVKGGGSGGAATATPTSLTIDPSAWRVTGEIVTLMAALKDDKGAPVPKAEVRFSTDAQFGPTKGQMDLGTAKTDANGVAFLDYQPTRAAQQQTITARFEGMGVYGESEQAIQIEVAGVPPPAYTMDPIGLEDVRRWAPPALVAVVLGIWAIFGFVLFQAVSISRVRERR